MSPMPWRTRRQDEPVAVAPPPAPRMPVTPNGPVYRTPVYGTGWTATEAAVLDLLADHGGDLTAHRTVHLEDL